MYITLHAALLVRIIDSIVIYFLSYFVNAFYYISIYTNSVALMIHHLCKCQDLCSVTQFPTM